MDFFIVVCNSDSGSFGLFEAGLLRGNGMDRNKSRMFKKLPNKI